MKSKAYFIFLIAISCHTILLCQEFAPIGAKWHFPTYDVNPIFGVSVFESIKDTTIENKLCRVIFKDNYSCFSNSGNHYIHQRNDSIFRYDEELEAFKLLFIQNAEVGEVWTIPQSPQLELDSMFCIVDSISFLHLNTNDSLRIQHVTLRLADYIDINQNGDTTYYDSYPYKIYERIGFDIAIFPVIFYTICDSDHEQEISCYQDNEIGLIEFSNDGCISSLNEELHSNLKIDIYPNPAKNYLNINSSNKNIDKIEVIDLYGKTINTIINIRSNIDLPKLQNGCYILKIHIDNQTILKKIIIKS